MGRKRGPRGRSVDLSVHQGITRQLDATRIALNQATERNSMLEGLLVSVVVKAGGVIDVDELPQDRKYSLEAERRPGGIVLFVTDEAPKGQEGKTDARDNAMPLVRSADNLGRERGDRQEDAGRR